MHVNIILAELQLIFGIKLKKTLKICKRNLVQIYRTLQMKNKKTHIFIHTISMLVIHPVICYN